LESAMDELRKLDAEYGEDNKILLKLWNKFLEKKKKLQHFEDNLSQKEKTEVSDNMNTSHNTFRDVHEVMSVQTQPVRLHRTAKFFGTINFPCNFLLWGIHGGGKSTFSLIMLQDLLLEKDAKILYAMTEEKIKTGRLKERITRAKVNINGVIFNDALTLDSLRELLENNQDLKYVVIDSVNMLRSNSRTKQIVTEDEVLALMEDFDNRSFIFIAHSVKDDTTYRGFPRLANMVDTVIHVSNGVARTKKHRDDKANNEMSIYSPVQQNKTKLTIKGLVI
ncbi:hypothetical protein, partial [Flavobacterium filum]|uniref:hypothetical protein n=1 Tax=Flavobacterium filum TaxID=370974 RepID=UPI0023F4B099